MISQWISTMSQADAAVQNGLVGLSLLSKGLLTTVIGLLGVFLVLTLFFITIKLMQGIKTKEK